MLMLQTQRIINENSSDSLPKFWEILSALISSFDKRMFDAIFFPHERLENDDFSFRLLAQISSILSLYESCWYEKKSKKILDIFSVAWTSSTFIKILSQKISSFIENVVNVEFFSLQLPSCSPSFFSSLQASLECCEEHSCSYFLFPIDWYNFLPIQTFCRKWFSLLSPLRSKQQFPLRVWNR